jgi:hypothetical protein
MKKILITALAAIALLSTSCFKDLGNYTYIPNEKITISGIAPSYDKVSLVDKITLTPSVVSTMEGAAFDYRWGIYETAVQGTAPKVDTIGRELALDYLVVQPAKGWVLVFMAKNKKTGYTAYATSTINVITQFTRGWYVAKEEGGKTDVDQFLTPTSITPGTKIENVYSLANSKKLDGKPTIFGFYSDYKSTVTGTIGNTRALFIITDKDASVVNINTFKEIRNINTLFYEPPTVKAPDFVCNGSQAQYFANNGQLQSIYAMSSNTGVFGARQLKDNSNTPYKLSKYFMTGAPIYDPVFFDEMSSSFISASGAGSVMNAMTQAAGSSMPANNNNKTLLYMGTKTSSPLTGYAVLQDKTNPAIRILSALSGTAGSFLIKNDTIKATDKIFNATRYTLNNADESMIYFVVGNEVWSRNLANKFEQLQYTAPVGETITFIRHSKYTTTSEVPYAFNYIIIGTKNGASYTVRMFTKSSGNLAATPAITLSGNGSVGDVIYIAPNIGGTTHQNTF